MRRFLIVALVLLAVLSISGLSAQQDSPTIPFDLIDSVPLSGEELEGGEPITLYFDQPVDCATAQAAVSISPAISGEITCDEQSRAVTFTPAEDYAQATTYMVTVSDALRAQNGTPLAEAATLSFSTVGSLTVREVLPAPGSTGIETDALITVIFSRPVVPLTIAEDMGDLPNPLAITPAVEGEGEWLNTSIYVFRPEPALAGGTEYTVTVPAGLEAADGATLNEPVRWTFRTVNPAIVETAPLDGAVDVGLDEEIMVRFNQPMNRESVEAGFYLRPDTQSEGSVEGTFEWAEDSAGFSFTPAENLRLDTFYTAGFDSATTFGQGGDMPLTGQSEWSFVTVPLPAIIQTSPFDGQTDAPPYGGFTIYFASPMNPETLFDKVTIEPEPWREFDDFYYDWDDSYYLSFPTEPSTTYTVTIAPGMEDVYGNAIQNGLTVTYTTLPYVPDVSLQTPGVVGFYNAYNDQTQLFLTHRNVSRVDLSLFAFNVQGFVNRLMAQSYDPAASVNTVVQRALRYWSIVADTPENASRYELLNLGEAAQETASCPGAMESRVQVGDLAIVVTEPDPIRARSNPGSDGEILDLLYRDYRLEIIDGPVCADGVAWWQVRLRDERTAWVAEGADDEYYLDVFSAGQSTEVTVEPTASESEALAPGMYLLTANAPELAERGIDPRRHFMMVSTANLVLKSTIDSVTVWATDVNSGQPLVDVPISIYQENVTGEVASGRTDANGLLRLDVPRASDLYVTRVAVLETEEHFGLSSSNWSDGIEGYQFGHNTNEFPARYQVYAYTDRPIYRPDQPVYFRGIVREQDDVRYLLPDFDSVPVEIYNNEGEIVYEADLPLTPFGTFSGQFDIAADAGLGFYRINVRLPSTSQFREEGGGVSFTVAEYRVPEFQVEVTAEQDEVVQNSTINVLVDSSYFFGGRVSDAIVTYSVRSEPYSFNYEGQGYYDFADYNYDGGPGVFYDFYGQEVASGEGVTDENGQLLIEIPADLEDATQSALFTIEAVVQDESGLTVAGRTEVVVHKGLIYIGARPEQYVGVAGEEANIEIVAVDWDSEGVAGQEIEVEVVERRWYSVQEEDEAGRTTWTWEVEEIPVTGGSVTTDENGDALYTFTPPNGGIFQVTITSRDSAGNEVVASTTLWVSSREYVSWRQQNSNRIDLISDQNDYEIGDTAEILITSPFQGEVNALVTVERGDVLRTEVITMDSNSYVYELPITEDFAPNVFVTVLIVKGVDDSNPVAGFRMGIIELGVEIERKEITIQATPDREQAGPRETVTYTIETTDYEGNPVSAEVGVGLTDLATLSIGEPNSTPILRFFYGEQGLGVRTGTPLTRNTDQITQTVLDTIKGGGGGGEGGIFDIREEFVDTPYWNPSIITDENGRATISITLPDNLTTWRLDARAVTRGEDGEMLVGEDTFDLLSTKPLLIRPVTPRFAVVGDVISLLAIVNNNTGQDMEVEVFIEGAGFTLQGDLSQTVTIPAGGRQRVVWPVTISDVGALDLTFFANGGDGQYTDASKPPLGQGDERLLPVYKYEAPETVGTGGLLREAGERTEAIALPQRFDVTQGELTINLDHSLAATTIDGLTYLRNFPYQCIEQTVSRFLPNIMTYRALESLGVADAELEANLNLTVNFALQRLYAQQKPNGGWGWFVQDQSNALTTAYALIGLSEARNSGFAVADGVIRNAQSYLRTTFVVPGLDVETWRLNRQAFVLYALARSGAPDVARTTTLYESRARLDYYAKAFLALTLHMIDPTDNSRTETLLSDLFNGAITSANGTHWEEAETDYWNWNTDTRTTAIVLEALVTLRPDSDLIPNVVRWLMVARTADAWETTQETAWAVMALTDWMVVSGELNPDYTYSATFNGETLHEGQALPENVKESAELRVDVADMLADQINELVIARGDGPGVLYYTAYLRVYLPVPEIEPLNRGIIVERRYVNPETGETVNEARVGELIQVRLTIIAPNDLHYAIIEDPIPAGTEGVDPGLETSQQIGTQPGLDDSDPLSRGWGWWWFSNIEFRDEKVVLFSTYLPAGTYEYVYNIRAGLEGVYNVIPTTGQEFYFPEVYGRGAGSVFTVLPVE